MKKDKDFSKLRFGSPIYDINQKDILRPGEVVTICDKAEVILPNGNTETNIKIGDGVHTLSELPYVIINNTSHLATIPLLMELIYHTDNEEDIDDYIDRIDEVFLEDKELGQLINKKDLEKIINDTLMEKGMDNNYGK